MDTTGETGTEIGEGKGPITTRRRMGIGIAGRETRGEQTIITAGGTLIFLSQHRISTVGATIRTTPRAKVARDHVQDHTAPVSPLLHAAGSSAVFTDSSTITPALPREFLPVLRYAASPPNAPPPHQTHRLPSLLATHTPHAPTPSPLTAPPSNPPSPNTTLHHYQNPTPKELPRPPVSKPPFSHPLYSKRRPFPPPSHDKAF
ncbi:hypothetical protein M422DRAFT_244090 [Sphaerobolus stellatus SS14]|nr:hypothetical protein M422DRAFT_244090 [Sphaerobolus stellatus SS14]